MKLKIGINIDGILVNKNDFQYKQGMKFFQNKPSFVNEAAYHFRDMFNCSKEEQEKFWKKNLLKYYIHSVPEVGASEFTKRLKENDYTIYLIANRRKVTEKSVFGDILRLVLNYWLKSNNIFYDEIIYCNHNNSLDDKYDACKRLDLDYVIDDKISDIVTLSEISKVLVYNREYNIGLAKYDRFYNFDEIANFLLKNNKRKEKKYE